MYTPPGLLSGQRGVQHRWGAQFAHTIHVQAEVEEQMVQQVAALRGRDLQPVHGVQVRIEQAHEGEAKRRRHGMAVQVARWHETAFLQIEVIGVRRGMLGEEAEVARKLEQENQWEAAQVLTAVYCFQRLANEGVQRGFSGLGPQDAVEHFLREERERGAHGVLVDPHVRLLHPQLTDVMQCSVGALISDQFNAVQGLKGRHGYPALAPDAHHVRTRTSVLRPHLQHKGVVTVANGLQDDGPVGVQHAEPVQRTTNTLVLHLYKPSRSLAKTM